MLNNFIYAQEKSLFLEQLRAGNILDEAIVFIEDTGEIWNHGTYFAGDCGFDPEVIREIQTAVANLKASKQDTISDLATIRIGASAGATAVQPETLLPLESTVNLNSQRITELENKLTWGVIDEDTEVPVQEDVVNILSATYPTEMTADKATDTVLVSLLNNKY